MTSSRRRPRKIKMGGAQYDGGSICDLHGWRLRDMTGRHETRTGSTSIQHKVFQKPIYTLNAKSQHVVIPSTMIMNHIYILLLGYHLLMHRAGPGRLTNRSYVWKLCSRLTASLYCCGISGMGAADVLARAVDIG
jgi:hypothetical protein